MKTPTAVRGGQQTSSVSGAPQLPQVNLLPPEIRAGRQLSNLKPWLGIALLAAVLGAGLLIVWSNFGLRSAENELSDTQDENAALVAQQAQFSEVPQVLADLDTIKSARLYGMSVETMWRPYISAISATAPAGVSVEAMAMTLVTADALSAVPGVEPMISQVTFDARSLTLPDTAAWLEGLDAIEGLSNAWFTSATLSEENGIVHYVVSGSVDVTFDALALRFLDTEEDS